MNLELRHLRYFLAIIETGNFSRAADRLLISQPALSAQIKQLEMGLKTKLFDRATRQVTITEAGEVLLPYAQKILLEISEAEQAITELHGLVRGDLTIGVVQTINACLIPQVSSSFLIKYPGISLRILELSASEIEQGIAEGTLALGISFIPTELESIDEESLFTEKLVVAISRKHKYFGRKSISIESIKNDPFVTFPEGFWTRRLTDQLFDNTGIKPRIVFETNTIQSILTAVGSSDMVTIVPALALRLKECEELCSLKIQEAGATRTLGFLWRQGTSKRKAAVAFAEITRQTLSKRMQPAK